MSKKYDTFAAYLEDVYYNQIFSKIKSYLFNSKGRLDLSTSVVSDPSYVKLSDFKIMGVNFHESDTDKIECKVTVCAEIEISGCGRRDYESDSTECWISIPFSATLRNGLQQVSIGYASEYSRELFRAEDALTKYLVPYIYAKDLDKHAERFLEKYCPRALEEPMPLPIKEIVENMGLTVYHAPLPDGIFGRTYFNDANVEVFTNKTCSETEDRTIRPGTILVNPDVVFMRNIGSTNNTVIHECVHWDKHYKFFELQKLLNPDIQAISCAVVEDYKKKSNELADELSWMEWQANALAPKILIPAKTGKAKLSEILNRLHRAYAINYIEDHPFAAVLLDMGLGKTSITLTAIADLLFDSFEVHKVLVIAPLRVARDTWSAELQKWDQLHHLTYSVAVGSEAERKAALTKKADIYIINRENVQWLIEKTKLPFDYDMVVVDELSSFKNHQSKRFKALMQVRPRIKRVVGLTGTPASNGLMDLWAEFKVIDMGKRLGRFITYYRQEYFVPDAMNGQIVYSYRPKPGAEQAIYRKISDITISMKSTDHLKMPELISSEYKRKKEAAA